MSGYLYRFEARGIQSYILGHRKLKRLLGASAIVRELVREVLVEVLGEIGVPKDKVLMSAAGMAMVEFRDEPTLRTFLRVWPLVVATKAPGLRTVQAWVPLLADEAATHAALEKALDRARSTPPVELPAGNPVMERSQHRKLPALSKPHYDEDGRPEFVDAAAAAAIQADVDLRRVIYTDYHGQSLPAPKRDFPRDLNQMTDGHYIAVIHADGNAIGDWFDKTSSFAVRRENSEHLKKVSLDALRAAIKTIDGPGHHLLGVPILFGGDDLVMIIRADKAIAFLEVYNAEFMRGFEGHNAKRSKKKPICISAGVAYVRPNHAFYLAHRLASELGKRAKEASKREHSSVWFHRFTDLLADSPPRQLCPIRFGAPLDAAVALAERLKARDIARGPVRQMLTAIEDHRPSQPQADRETSTEYDEAQKIWERFREVHSLRLSSKAFNELVGQLDAVHPGLAGSPFISRATREGLNEKFSPWPDINTLAVVQRASLKVPS